MEKDGAVEQRAGASIASARVDRKVRGWNGVVP